MKKVTTAVLALFGGIALAAQEVPPVLAIGSDLPSFSLPGIDGKTHTEKDYADAKILCVIFTCNHCPDSVAAAARTEEIHQDYKDKGVAIIAVNANNPASLRPDELGYSPYNDSFEEMKPFAESYGCDLSLPLRRGKPEIRHRMRSAVHSTRLHFRCRPQATLHRPYGRCRPFLRAGRKILRPRCF